LSGISLQKEGKTAEDYTEIAIIEEAGTRFS